MRTRDRLSSLACQFSCPEYLLSQYDPNTTKSDYELIARFWLKFTYSIIYADLLLEKRGFGGAQNNFFLWKGRNLAK